MRVCLIVLLTAVCSAAASAPDSYRQAMARGEALLRKKDARAAIAAFRAALDARPGDARALTELSWAEIVAGDFADAREAAEKSVAVPGSADALRAAQHYNLGRAREGLGDAAGARTAYEESLKLRENTETRARLVKLGGAARDPFARHLLVGPFADPEDYCAQHPGDLCDVNRDVEVRSGKRQLGAPFLAIARFKTETKTSETGLSLHIALSLDDGWYVFTDVADVGNRKSFDFTEMNMVGKRLFIAYDAWAGRFDWDEEVGVIVCGVGEGKRPSCVGPVPLYQAHNRHVGGKEDGRDTTTISYRCRAELVGDVLVVGRSNTKVERQEGVKTIAPPPAACNAEPVFGKHPLTF